MKEKLLKIIPLVALVVALTMILIINGRGHQEMVEVTKCSKLVDKKYYQATFFGIPISGPDYYYIFDDGEKISERDAYLNFNYNSDTKELCRMKLVSKDKR